MTTIRREQLSEVVPTPPAEHVACATRPNALRVLLQISKHSSVGFILPILPKTERNLPELATLP